MKISFRTRAVVSKSCGILVCAVRLSSNLHNFRVRAQPLTKRICQKTFLFFLLSFFLMNRSIPPSRCRISVSPSPRTWLLPFVLLLSWFKQNLPVDLVIVFSLWPNISFTSSRKQNKTKKIRNHFEANFLFAPLFFLKIFYGLSSSWHLFVFFSVSIGHLSRPFVVWYIDFRSSQWSTTFVSVFCIA